MLSAADRGWPAAEEKEGRRIRSFWVAGALVLVIGIGIQYTWFQRSTLLERYPDLRPPLEQLCGLFRCKLPLRRDLQAVRLLSRDVRPHPRYQDSLLINATLVNEASFAQPYPVLQLEFSDVSGTKLIARRFKPMEYLDKNIKIDEGMPPGSPVHIVIELQGLKQTPVSYEFKFL
jgi:hypothetical protein